MWLTGNNARGTMVKSDYESKRGTGSGRFGRLTHRSDRGIELESLDDRPLNIYQSKTYGVSFEDREDKEVKLIKREADIGATVTIQHTH